MEQEKIFISYSRKDKAKVFAIRDEIEKATSQKCWIDLDGIESDKQFDDVIISAINKTEIFIFMYSANSAESEWTKGELRLAKNKNKKIVFVLIDNAKFNDWFVFTHGDHDIITYSNGDEKAKLLRNLKGWCSTSIPSHTASTTSPASYNLKVKSNKDCKVLIDGDEKGTAKANTISKFPLAKGEYSLSCIAIDSKEQVDMEDVNIVDGDVLRNPVFGKGKIVFGGKPNGFMSPRLPEQERIDASELPSVISFHVAEDHEISFNLNDDKTKYILSFAVAGVAAGAAAAGAAAAGLLGAIVGVGWNYLGKKRITESVLLQLALDNNLKIQIEKNCFVINVQDNIESLCAFFQKQKKMENFCRP